MDTLDPTALAQELTKLRAALPGMVAALDRAEEVVRAGGITQDADAAWLVPSTSEPGTVYTVSPTGTRCTCKGWQFAPTGKRWCRHTLAVRLILAVERAEVAPVIS